MNSRNLELAEGCIAYDDDGSDAPLVLCVPGLGDLRSEYRFLAPTSETPASEWPQWTCAATGNRAPDGKTIPRRRWGQTWLPC